MINYLIGNRPDSTYYRIRKDIPEVEAWNSLSDYFSLIKDYSNIIEISIITKHINSIVGLSKLHELEELTIVGYLLEEVENISELLKLKKLVQLKIVGPLTDKTAFNILELPCISYINFTKSNLSDPKILSKAVENNIAINILSNKFEDIPFEFYHYLNSNAKQLVIAIHEAKNTMVRKQDYETAADLRDLQSVIERAIIDEGNNDKFYLTDKHSHHQDTLNRGIEIYLGTNPINTPPVEIFSKGKEAVYAYYEYIGSNDIQRLYEAKVLIIGEGESGKTTLARKLVDRDAPMPSNEFERTEGIEITTLTLDNFDVDGNDCHLNIWDFGGQEIYHATHQFFLTKRSIYLIVNNTRSNTTDFNEWLQKVEVLAGNSPVIIIQNQVAGSITKIDLRGLRSRFPNITHLHEVDLANAHDTRFEKLLQSLQTQIGLLDHVGSKVPSQWINLRAKIEEKKIHHKVISLSQYQDLCYELGINNIDEQFQVSGFFHDLGIFLHFQDDMVLKNLIILHNSWATQGVYNIFDDKFIINNHGVFSYTYIKDKFKQTSFRNMHDEIISLMKKFELCYRIPIDDQIIYVAPQLLPAEAPLFNWTDTNNLIILYDYDYMPKGIISRIMVRLYRFINDIEKTTWKSGCIFSFNNTLGKVIETYGTKKIEIRIRGANTLMLSTLITSVIDNINESFDGLKVDKLVPCNCIECLQKNKSHFYKYDDLMRRKLKGKKRTIECVISGEDIDYISLLEGIFGVHINNDPTNTIKSKIRELVSKNELPKSISELSKINQNAAVLLQHRLAMIEEQSNAGVMQETTYYRELSKIGYDIISVLSSS